MDLLDGIEHELHELCEHVVDVFVVNPRDPLGAGSFPQVILEPAYVLEVSEVALRRPGSTSVREVPTMKVLILHHD